jgi:biotin operon repressor
MKVQIKLKGFTPILDKLVEKYGIVTAAVYGAVWRYAQQEDGECWASANTIANRLNLSRRTIARHLKDLVKDGYLIDLTPNLKGESHHYTYTAKANISGVIEGGVTESHRGCDRESQVGVTESHTKIQDKIQDKIQSPNGGNGSTNNKQPTPHPDTNHILTEQQTDELLIFGKHPNSDTANPSFDTIQEIQKAGWEIRNHIVEQAIAYYLEAVREHHTAFAVPNNETVRKDWYKAVAGHLKDHRVDDLKIIYPAAIERLKERGMTFSRPGSLTKSLPDVAMETQTGDVVAWL